MASDTKRWDVCVAREDGEKTFWTRIGVMFENKGGGFGIYLDALPLTGKLVCFEHKDREPGSDDGPPAKGGYQGRRR